MYLNTGLDFSDMELEFLFRNGSMVGDTACVSVTINDDNLIETTEQFQLRLNMIETVSGDENSVLVDIEDNDRKYVCHFIIHLYE